MHLSPQSVVGDIVTGDYRTAAVFKEYAIDFCCNGQRSIREACSEKAIDLAVLMDRLAIVVQQPTNSPVTDFVSWPLDLLADYIEKKHHRYVTEKIQEITPYLDKITAVHGAAHPELAEVNHLFKVCGAAMTMHMKKEELVLFPYIRKLEAARGVPVQASFASVAHPVQAMMQDHDGEGERFRRISRLTNQYTTPADGCTTYALTLRLLQEFEADLHLHIHLENNILFPKAIALEQSAGSQ